MTIRSAKDTFTKDEVVDILKRNVALYKGERDFVEYIVNLAIYLLENQQPAPSARPVQVAAASLGPDADFDPPAGNPDDPTGRFILDQPTAREIAPLRPEPAGSPAKPIMLDPGKTPRPTLPPLSQRTPLPAGAAQNVAPPTAMAPVNPRTPLMPSGTGTRVPALPAPPAIPSPSAGAAGPPLPPAPPSVLPPPAVPPKPPSPQSLRPSALPPAPFQPAAQQRPLTPFGTARLGASGAFLKPDFRPGDAASPPAPMGRPDAPAGPPPPVRLPGIEVQGRSLTPTPREEPIDRRSRELPRMPGAPPPSPFGGPTGTAGLPPQGPSLGAGDSARMKVYRVVKGQATNSSLDTTICPVCGVNAGRAKSCPACGNIFKP